MMRGGRAAFLGPTGRSTPEVCYGLPVGSRFVGTANVWIESALSHLHEELTND